MNQKPFVLFNLLLLTSVSAGCCHVSKGDIVSAERYIEQRYASDLTRVKSTKKALREKYVDYQAGELECKKLKTIVKGYEPYTP